MSDNKIKVTVKKAIALAALSSFIFGGTLLSDNTKINASAIGVSYGAAGESADTVETTQSDNNADESKPVRHIGVTYGQSGDNLPPESSVIGMYKAN